MATASVQRKRIIYKPILEFQTPQHVHFNRRIDHPDWRVIALRDLVKRRWPDHFFESMEYRVDGFHVIAEKRFLKEIVSSRTIGDLMPGEVAQWVDMEICRDWIVGPKDAIEKARRLERAEWKHKRRVAILFSMDGGREQQ
ncbi:hypothetical protein K2X85_20620 [bacterium]|nr:hypothetical protein [bacterium]